MSYVTVDGVFMGANLHTQTFNDNTRYSVILDLYIPDSPAREKAISVRCEDVELLEHFQKNYTRGDMITLKCTLSAYQNNVYYKFVEEVKNAQKTS